MSKELKISFGTAGRMNKTAIISVIAAVIVVLVACVIFLNTGEEDNRNKTDSEEPDVSQKELTIRKELVVGDWVTVTVPTKANQFIMKFTVESIDGDIANLKVECDENNKYYQNLNHLTEITKVWKTLDHTSDATGGLYPVTDIDSVGHIPMYFKNWASMKSSLAETIGEKIFIDDGAKEVLVIEGIHQASCGMRACIIYDSSISMSESEYYQLEGSDDFTYEVATQSWILDKESGILWGFVAFGPIRIDSSIYEFH